MVAKKEVQIGVIKNRDKVIQEREWIFAWQEYEKSKFACGREEDEVMKWILEMKGESQME